MPATRPPATPDRASATAAMMAARRSDRTCAGRESLSHDLTSRRMPINEYSAKHDFGPFGAFHPRISAGNRRRWPGGQVPYYPDWMRMLAQRTVLAFLAVLTGVCPSTAQNAVTSAAQAAGSLLYPRTDRLERQDRLAVIGDVQRTSFWGRLVLAE